MIKKLAIRLSIDDDESALVEAIESEDYVAQDNRLTPERLAALQDTARATINEERVKISLRLPKSDLDRLNDNNHDS